LLDRCGYQSITPGAQLKIMAIHKAMVAGGWSHYQLWVGATSMNRVMHMT
jgi:hypothetical protein